MVEGGELSDTYGKTQSMVGETANVTANNAATGLTNQNNATGSTNQNNSTGITNLGGYAPFNECLTLGYGSSYEVNETAWVTLRSGTCGSVSNAINLSEINVAVEETEAGHYAFVHIRVWLNGTVILEWTERFVYDNGIYLARKNIILTDMIQGYEILVDARATDAGHVHLKALIYGRQFQSHTHSISDPQHGHTITDPQHGHAVSDPQHPHTLNEPSGGHIH